MRKVFLVFFLLILSSIASKAQFISPCYSQMDGISIGLEKNRSFFLEYGKGGFKGRLKHSLTFDRSRHQYWRIEGGYTLSVKILDVTCDLFYSSDWKFDNYNLGTQISLYSRFFDKYGNVVFRYVPYYDKELKFSQGWAVSGSLKVTNDIAFVAEYGRVPEYRIAYKRLYLGIVVKINNLSVYPLLEVPLYDNETHLSHSHIVVSILYTFNM